MSTRPLVSDQGVVLRTSAWPDYALIDSGDGRKLERYGRYRVVRPEPQCLWRPRLGADVWDAADAIFDPSDEDEAGNWRFRDGPIAPFPLSWDGVRFQGQFTNFRHLAFFPEQAANWAWLKQRIKAAGSTPKILNLFGYTGVASLACAAAGAAVTHVDASKRAIGWARDNAALAGLADKPVRWICEDARRYVQREVRRGARYDGIILDPPKYGRGPNNEVWRLFEDLPELTRLCAALLSENASFLLLNAYAARISGVSMGQLLAGECEERGGHIDWGELALKEEASDRQIGLSFFARWTPEAP